MASVSGISTISKVFTKLGDNSGSVVPMYVKDITADTLTSRTYFKEGGKRDGAEKTFEEFSTGVLWLGGIPAIKKFVFDKFIYPKKNINPDIDANRLFTKGGEQVADTIEFAAKKAKELGFNEQTEILEHTIQNKGLAKKLALSKFGVATAVTGAALFGLITFKQKRTEKVLEEQIRNEYVKEQQLKNNIENSDVTSIFKGRQTKDKTNKSNNPSFTGLANIGTFFMTNPIANTTLVDGVITGTRLVGARKAERWSEVGLKEGCELALAYGLAVPLQKGLEYTAEKAFDRPIKLDYSVLDSNVIKNAITSEQAQEGSSELLAQAKKIVELMGDDEPAKKGISGFADKVKNFVKPSKESLNIANEKAKNVIDFVFDEKNSAIADVFKRSGNVGTFTTKEGVEQLSLLSSIDPKSLKKTAQNTIDIIEKAAKKNIDPTEYLKKTKMVKGAAIISNILISATLIGYVQPKFSLWLRKKLHNGENTNPAIKELEQNIRQKIAFEGQQNQEQQKANKA